MKIRIVYIFSVTTSSLLLSTVLFSGCVGSYTSVHPSEQKEILEGTEGDRLKSKAPYEGAQEKESLVEFEIEIPGFPSWRRYYWTDKALWGNRGYVIGGPQATYVIAAESIPNVAGYEPILEELKFKLKTVGQPEDEIVVLEQPIYDQRRAYEETILAEQAGLPTEHLVKKGESLWLIAGYAEIFGNPLEWPKIYQANRDRILDPNLIYPDQKLRIPRGVHQMQTSSQTPPIQ
ncbi:MAG: LysM peptidoglycan-binding domain-containing protein [Candidatus Omnitrophica bacterium]|nr:LysM peptidoglycan-binding domain-containing protein [Candidatus Omnitrophota bacterium]